MKSCAVAICLLALVGGASAAFATTGSPVEKVVELLTDLKTKALADGAAEQKIFDKYACWCETTTQRKAEAIVAAKAELRALGQQILKLKGLIATLTAEIQELADNIADNQAAQDDATAVRTKQNTDYMGMSSETMQALAATETAVKVLADATASASLLQSATKAELQAKAATGVRNMIEVLPTRVQLSQEQISMLSEFAEHGARAEYAPQSASIQGILKDMYDTFSSNLEEATQTEASQNRLFEDFIAEKQKDMIKAKEVKAKKESEKAEAEVNLAETTQTYDDTHAQMEADIEFFDATKKACEEKSAEWNQRKSEREEEIAGITEALKILTSDAAREMFAKAIKPGMETSFLQVSSADSTSAASNAYMVLKKAASKAHSMRLASLAAAVRMAKAGHFDGVMKAIDEVMQTLKDEGQSDIEKKDQCKDEYLKTESKMKDQNWKIKNNVAKINKLQATIDARTAEKADTIEQIAQVTEDILDMETQRIAENGAFLNAKSDDEAAIELLSAAKDALTKFYKNNKVDMGEIQGSSQGAALLQDPVFEVSEDQAPDASFSGKGSRKTQSKGIVSIMTMLIEDLQDEVKNGIKNEAATQTEFEKTLAAAKKLKAELIEKKDTLEGTIAEKEDEKTAENADKDSNSADLKDETDYRKRITPDCDWIIGAFTGRAEARAAEMQGLTSAKEYLAGMSGASSLLERAKPFDDGALVRNGFLSLH